MPEFYRRLPDEVKQRGDLDFAFDQLLPTYGSMQIPQSKDALAKVISYFARHKRKSEQFRTGD
jgi:hypothetical protein